MPTSPDGLETAWDDRTLRDPHAQQDKARRVRDMFDAIAPTYERVNTLATFGRDAAWRRRAVRAAQVRPGDVVLDVCCGTGDMIRAFMAGEPAPAAVVGVDFSAQMLAGGRYAPSTTPLLLCRADALRLPVRDASVDVVSCAFGVRNFQDLPAGLRELRRVLRAGGRAVILEFAPPDNALLRWGYELYCNQLLPRLGALISRDRVGAYRYLPRSIQTFDGRGAMERRLPDAGFAHVRSEAMNLGGVVLYVAVA